MTDNNRCNLSAKDEALLILEYLENEQMSKTFLSFLEESKHLTQLRSRLCLNYLHPEQLKQETDVEVLDFQSFFNLSKETEHINQTFLSSQIDSTAHTQDLFFDDDFLNVGLNDLLSQTPPMDYQHELPDTPLPSVPPISTANNEDFNTALEQLFSMPPESLVTPLPPPVTVQTVADSTPKPSFTKCIVVTQDFLQSMYTQQHQQHPQPTISSSSINSTLRPKRRRRRFKAGKENHAQQRKLMPRA